MRLVLVIDDDEADRDWVVRSIGHMFTVCQASTAKVGFEMLDRLAPGCVILDYRLTDADGLDVLAQIVPTDAEVIFATGWGDEMVAAEAIKRGAFEYVVKGQITKESMCDTVERALRMAATSSQLAHAEGELGSLLGAAESELGPALDSVTEAFRSAEGATTLDGAKRSINEGIRRLEALSAYFSDLLGYATCAGRVPWERVDLYELVTSVAEEVPLPDGVRIEVSSLPSVLGDEPSLRTMFRALLENAGEHGGTELSRILVGSEHDDSRWIVTVEDNGVGARNVRTSGLPGLAARRGWGLPIADKVARHHGGDLAVHGIEGVGTKVVVRLPDR